MNKITGAYNTYVKYKTPEAYNSYRVMNRHRDNSVHTANKINICIHYENESS